MSLHSNTRLNYWVKKFTVEPCTNGHLSITATFLQRPPFFFFWRTVHTFTLAFTYLQRPPLYNGDFLLSPTWPLGRGSTVIILRLERKWTFKILSKARPYLEMYIFEEQFCLDFPLVSVVDWLLLKQKTSIRPLSRLRQNNFLGLAISH